MARRCDELSSVGGVRERRLIGVPTPAAEAAEELRDLLGTAVSQRVASGTTTVWMSGGWDSTAVFGAGQHALRPEARSRLRPVSISYPEGDPGNEDEFIRQVAAHWNADVHWLRSDDLQMLEGLEQRAARYDEPPAHLYELWNRGLAQGTRALGARVTLDGCGGDQLFQVSDVLLADLFHGGHWVKFARLARSRWVRGWRHVVRAGVIPLMPASLLRAGERVLGRRIPLHYLERSPTTWVRPEFMVSHRLRQRDLAALDQVQGTGLSHTESLLYLTLPIWGWGGAFMRGPLLQEGVEVRSPLLDLSVVDFALRRPVAERADGQETKRMLRQSMAGLLPAEVLAPRTHRTGMTIGFSRRRMKEAYPALIARLFAEPLRLADLGLVDPAELREATDSFIGGWCDEFVRVNLFHTMKTEFWLRGHECREIDDFASMEAGHSGLAFPAA